MLWLHSSIKRGPLLARVLRRLISRAEGFFAVSFGGGTGTVKLERSRDGSTWYDVSKDQDGNAASYALTGEEMAFDVFQADKSMQWRLNCTVYTSGTITWQMSQ